MLSDHYINKYRTSKQKIQNKVSKLESACRIKLVVSKTKCNEAKYHDSCFYLWCEVDDVADQNIELKQELCKYDN